VTTPAATVSPPLRSMIRPRSLLSLKVSRGIGRLSNFILTVAVAPFERCLQVGKQSDRSICHICRWQCSYLGFFLMISPVVLSIVATSFKMDAGSFKLWWWRMIGNPDVIGTLISKTTICATNDDVTGTWWAGVHNTVPELLWRMIVLENTSLNQ